MQLLEARQPEGVRVAGMAQMVLALAALRIAAVAALAGARLLLATAALAATGRYTAGAVAAVAQWHLASRRARVATALKALLLL